MDAAVAAVVSGTFLFALGWFLRGKSAPERPHREPTLASRLPERMEAPRLEDDFDLRHLEDVLDLDAREAGLRRQRQDAEKAAAELGQSRSRLEEERRLLERDRAALTEEYEHMHSLRLELEAALSRAASMTPQQAERKAMELAGRRIQSRAAQEERRLLAETRRRAREEARRLVAAAAARMAPETARELAQHDFIFPSPEAREAFLALGEAFTAETGVRVLAEEEGNRAVFSCLDARRRETARRLVERMLEGGDFSQESLKRLWAESLAAMDEADLRAGQKAAQEALGQRHAALPAEIRRALGRLRFVHTRPPHALQHAVETARAAAVMAAELGLPEEQARLAGLLHGVGLALPASEPAVHHAEAGAAFLAAHDCSAEVTEAVRLHAGEEPPAALAALLAAAEALVSSRPGGSRGAALDPAAQARRLERIEHAARQIAGVRAVQAVPAASELRVLVAAPEVPEAGLQAFAEQVANRLRDELRYPYESLLVTVVREEHAVAYA
jgi:ribonuclease Y